VSHLSQLHRRRQSLVSLRCIKHSGGHLIFIGLFIPAIAGVIGVCGSFSHVTLTFCPIVLLMHSVIRCPDRALQRLIVQYPRRGDIDVSRTTPSSGDSAEPWFGWLQHRAPPFILAHNIPRSILQLTIASKAQHPFPSHPSVHVSLIICDDRLTNNRSPLLYFVRTSQVGFILSWD